MSQKTPYFTPVEAAAFGLEQMSRQVFATIESLERLAMTIEANPETASEKTLALLQSADSWMMVVPRMAERIREILAPVIETDDIEIRRRRVKLSSDIGSETRELVV